MKKELLIVTLLGRLLIGLVRVLEGRRIKLSIFSRMAILSFCYVVLFAAPAQAQMCETIINENVCTTTPGCYWCPTMGACYPFPDCITCDLMSVNICMASPTCHWCNNKFKCFPNEHPCTCGNHIVEAPEQCDGGAFCTSNCTCPEGYENDGGNGCKLIVVPPVCGNGILEPGEECEAAWGRSCDPVTCKCTEGNIPDPENPGFCIVKIVCGNGILEPGEECEIFSRNCVNCLCVDGTIPDPVNLGFCITPQVCGNGILEGTEECDSTPNCGTDCTCQTGYVPGEAGSCNALPVAEAGLNETVHIGALVTLDGSASSDPDGNVPLTYGWSFASVPDGSAASLTGADPVHPTFAADQAGNYVIQLVVTDSLGAVSAPDLVTISTTNTAPVAEAGPDQAITLLGTLVQLDGTQSYDPDGDEITYSWAITGQPEGSSAALSGSDTATPSFTPDVYADYEVTLTVTDEYGLASELDTVKVSFTNVKPTAYAGGNQAVEVETTVTLEGSGDDANNDPLTYQWSIVSKPIGSTATLSIDNLPQTSFTADKLGSYVISLVVNDGFVSSDSSNGTVTATLPHEMLDILSHLIEAINGLMAGDFKNPNMKNTLTNKINAVLQLFDQGLYNDAYDKLVNDILQKADGCATIGSPDKNDWIINCGAQGQVYPLVIQAISLLNGWI